MADAAIPPRGAEPELGPALLVAAASVVELAIRGVDRSQLVAAISCVAVTCAGLAWRRVHAFRVSIIAGVVVAAVALVSPGSRLGEAMPHAEILAFVLLAYSIGAHEARRIGLVGLTGLAVGIGAASMNVVPALIFTVPPWIAGRMVCSRRRLIDQLLLRARELEAERETLAREAVRYERVRIARELHDIVAHCVSLMVVQAGAGRRLAEHDPARAAKALDHIIEAAGQAHAEMGRLVEMLGSDARDSGSDLSLLVGDLVTRAAATGMPVNYRTIGSVDAMPRTAVEAAYRVIQESVTNALKHAPGAAIDIAVSAVSEQLVVVVVNGPSSSATSGLHRSGGGHGLTGMRERVLATGGELTAGPSADGGWQVAAAFPVSAQRSQPAPPAVLKDPCRLNSLPTGGDAGVAAVGLVERAGARPAERASSRPQASTSRSPAAATPASPPGTTPVAGGLAPVSPRDTAAGRHWSGPR